jgi:hypothetical protein
VAEKRDMVKEDRPVKRRSERTAKLVYRLCAALVEPRKKDVVTVQRNSTLVVALRPVRKAKVVAQAALMSTPPKQNQLPQRQKQPQQQQQYQEEKEEAPSMPVLSPKSPSKTATSSTISSSSSQRRSSRQSSSSLHSSVGRSVEEQERILERGLGVCEDCLREVVQQAATVLSRTGKKMNTRDRARRRNANSATQYDVIARIVEYLVANDSALRQSVYEERLLSFGLVVLRFLVVALFELNASASSPTNPSEWQSILLHVTSSVGYLSTFVPPRHQWCCDEALVLALHMHGGKRGPDFAAHKYHNEFAYAAVSEWEDYCDLWGLEINKWKE